MVFRNMNEFSSLSALSPLDFSLTSVPLLRVRRRAVRGACRDRPPARMTGEREGGERRAW
jgi:hypothetical protein